ncbi:hypothetical protein AYI68_g3880 [Smittium mucronatum]|uniref:Uncharacterized protein n=1 Tax=Smittium mucronatum TaxID=133383 RepID=A0A1R0GYS8_9FUNG|nr:hypothetical protein AYI68_g3880 [Smittium mucronatum]
MSLSSTPMGLILLDEICKENIEYQQHQNSLKEKVHGFSIFHPIDGYKKLVEENDEKKIIDKIKQVSAVQLYEKLLYENNSEFSFFLRGSLFIIICHDNFIIELTISIDDNCTNSGNPPIANSNPINSNRFNKKDNLNRIKVDANSYMAKLLTSGLYSNNLNGYNIAEQLRSDSFQVLEFSPGIFTSISADDFNLHKLASERIWQDTWSAIILASRDNRLPPLMTSPFISNDQNGQDPSRMVSYNVLPYSYSISGFKYNIRSSNYDARILKELNEVLSENLSTQIVINNGHPLKIHHEDQCHEPLKNNKFSRINIRPPYQVGYSGYVPERHLENLLIMNCIGYREYCDTTVEKLLLDNIDNLIINSQNYTQAYPSKNELAFGVQYQNQKPDAQGPYNSDALYNSLPENVLHNPSECKEIQDSITFEHCGPDMYFKPPANLLKSNFPELTNFTDYKQVYNHLNQNFLDPYEDSEIQSLLGIPIDHSIVSGPSDLNNASNANNGSQNFANSGIKVIDVNEFSQMKFKIQSWFGKAYVSPFPFILFFIYDEAPGYVVRICSFSGWYLYLQQNRNPEIVDRKRIRLSLRALENKTLTFSFEEEDLLNPEAIFKANTSNGSADTSVQSLLENSSQELDQGFKKIVVFKAKFTIIRHHSSFVKKTQVGIIPDWINTSPGFIIKLDVFDSQKLVININNEIVSQESIIGKRNGILSGLNLGYNDQAESGFDPSDDIIFSLFKHQVLRNSNFEMYKNNSRNQSKPLNASDYQNNASTSHHYNVENFNSYNPNRAESIPEAASVVNEMAFTPDEPNYLRYSSRIKKEDIDLLSTNVWDIGKSRYEIISKIQSKIVGVNSDFSMSLNMYFLLKENEKIIEENFQTIQLGFKSWRTQFHYEFLDKQFGLSYLFTNVIFAPHPSLAPAITGVSLRSPVILDGLTDLVKRKRFNKKKPAKYIDKKIIPENNNEYLVNAEKHVVSEPWYIAASIFTSSNNSVGFNQSHYISSQDDPNGNSFENRVFRNDLKYNYRTIVATDFNRFSEIYENSNLPLLNFLPTYHELVYVLKLFEKSKNLKNLINDHYDDLKMMYERLDAIRPYYHPRDPSVVVFDPNSVLNIMGLQNIVSGTKKNNPVPLGKQRVDQNTQFSNVNGYNPNPNFCYTIDMPQINEIFEKKDLGGNSRKRHPEVAKVNAIGFRKPSIKKMNKLVPPPLVNPHPLRFVWYLFWDDLFRRYAPVDSFLTRYEPDFNPFYPGSIAYNPIPRRKLEVFLNNRGLFRFDQNNINSEKRRPSGSLKTPQMKDFDYITPKNTLLNTGVLNALYSWLSKFSKS